MKSKSIFFISVGSLNLIHGLVHLFQFIQSAFLISHSFDRENHGLLDSPFLSIIWAIIGIASLVIGIKDYRHHKKCH